MLRQLTKTGLATGMHLFRMDKLVAARRGIDREPLVVSYHRVVENFREAASRSIPAMLVSTRTLEAHLDWFGRHYQFVSLDELAAILEGRLRTQRPPIALTFDDGYADFYHLAYPLLRRKGIPSAVFVVTDLLGTTRLQAHDELYLLVSGLYSEHDPAMLQQAADCLRTLPIAEEETRRLGVLLKTERDVFKATKALLVALRQADTDKLIRTLRTLVYVPEASLREFHALDWNMLREMLPRGVTIGSHTRSHALLANERGAGLLREISGSREILERELGVPIEHLAYPDGRFNEQAVTEVARAGYRYAYTTCTHRDRRHPQLTIPRRLLWEKSCMDSFGRFSPAILSCQVRGVFDPAARCQQEHWA